MSVARRQRVTALATVLLLAGAWNPCDAGIGVWTTSGPYGAYVLAAAANPRDASRLYAGTQHGLYRSSDGGASWVRATQGMNAGSIVSLAVDPAQPEIVFASCGFGCGYYGGVYRSTNSGRTWSTTGWSYDQMRISPGCLALDPTTPSTIFVGGSGSFKSTDSGGTWVPISPNLSAGTRISAIAVDPSVSANVYIATESGNTGEGVLKSTDGGSTWTVVGLNGSPVFGLAIDPAQTSRIFAGTDKALFRSTDAGASWSSVLAFAGSSYSPITIDGSDSRLVYAGGRGAFRSTDSGATWASAGPELAREWITALIVDPANHTIVHAATSTGWFRSTDSGASWTARDVGMTDQETPALSVDATGTLRAGTGRGLFKSIDHGVSWSPVPAVRARISSIAAAPSNGAVLYCGDNAGTLFRTSDGGATWTSTATALDRITALAFDGGNPAVVLAGTEIGNSADLLYKSTDSGTTWRVASPGFQATWADFVAGLFIEPLAPATAWAFTYSGALLRSTDSGDSWTRKDPAAAQSVYSFAIDPRDPSVLHAGSNQGVLRSTDGGDSWEPVSAWTGVHALAVDPASSGTLLAGTNWAVYRSTDSGATWIPLAGGLPTGNFVLALGFDPSRPGTALAALGSHGVWEFTDDPRPSTKFFTLTPCRLFDTRNSAGADAASPILAGGDTRVFPIAGRCGVPPSAKALSVNATSVQPESSGSLTLFRSEFDAVPEAGTLTLTPGRTRANNAILGLSLDGSQAFKASDASQGDVHFVLDVNGYFE